MSEKEYESDIVQALSPGEFGGIQDPKDYTPVLNCLGKPVEEHAYMRTRLVAPALKFQIWREYFDSPDPDSMLGIYEENTTLHFTCTSCCGRGQ